MHDMLAPPRVFGIELPQTIFLFSLSSLAKLLIIY